MFPRRNWNSAIDGRSWGGIKRNWLRGLSPRVAGKFKKGLKGGWLESDPVARIRKELGDPTTYGRVGVEKEILF